MQYQFNERFEYVKSVEFLNTLPLHVKRIRFFKEEDTFGSFVKKEFRYSYDGSIWTNWNTLTQTELSRLELKDRPNFFLHVKYSRPNINSANIQRWYLFYDEYGETPPVDPSAKVDAYTLQGEGPDYYLDRSNHLGPITGINVFNVPDGSSVGTYSHRVDTSYGTDLFFRRVEGRGGINVYDDNSKIVVDGEFIDDTVINIGDGSANVFAGYDSSRGILLRSFVAGSGAVIIQEDGSTISIGIDASFGGDYGVNIGNGDASVYSSKIGSNLAFKTLKGTETVKLTTIDDTIIIDTSLSEVQPINGGVWITNISSTQGNVGEKVFSSDGAVLDYCITDTSLLSISVLAIPGHTNYKPVVTINSTQVNLVSKPDRPLFDGSILISLHPSDTSVTVRHEDGAYWSTLVDRDLPPTILNATFIGGYPGSQTQLKAGDTFKVRVVTDVSITSIEVNDYGALQSGVYTVNGTDVSVNCTIANRGTTTQFLGFSLRVRKANGSASQFRYSAADGSTNGVNLVYVNNTYPAISFSSVTYPASQGAIKNGENATVNHTVSNFSTIQYTSPNGQLTIANPLIYEPSKLVSYLSGGYNYSTSNITVTAIRAENGASTQLSNVVRIANTPTVLTVSNGSSRFRSGGNDGTIIQSHTVTITSDQRLLSSPTLQSAIGGGSWQSSSTFSGGPTTWVNILLVHDNDPKGTYSWGNIYGVNLAGIPTIVNSGATTYVLGGFVQRTITLQPFANEANMNVEAVDYSKVTLSWEVKPLPTRSPVGTQAPPPIVGAWCLQSLNTNPTTIRILDTEATGSRSQSSVLTVQESI